MVQVGINLFHKEARAVVSQLMCHEVLGKLPDPESDILPYSTLNITLRIERFFSVVFSDSHLKTTVKSEG